MKVIVMGSGVIGVTTAWYLHQAGHEVTVVDRQPVSGLETSFANAGQISASHAQPWANPGAPLSLLKGLGREESALLFRLRADPAQWLWAIRFLRECLPGRTRRNTASLLALGVYSRSVLAQLRGETGIEYDAICKGILHLYTDYKSLTEAADRARDYRALGYRMEVLGASECVRVEPALRAARTSWVGGTYAPDDEAGDAHAFTRAVERYAVAHGVKFSFGCTVQGIEQEANQVTGLRVTNRLGESEVMRADAYVSCLGVESPLLLRQIGVALPIFPVKGYSVTIPIERPDEAPLVSVTHERWKLFSSRLGARLRIAGTAEWTGYDRAITPTRCDALLRQARLLFPTAGDYDQVQRWAGLRPATPSNCPIIGRSRYGNLFLNTGHGSLGWTLACGSARAVADLVSGRRPEVDYAFQ